MRDLALSLSLSLFHGKTTVGKKKQHFCYDAYYSHTLHTTIYDCRSASSISLISFLYDKSIKRSPTCTVNPEINDGSCFT